MASPPSITTTPAGPPSAPESDRRLLDAAGVLERHASNPSAFLALNQETLRFEVPGIDGFVAYRRAGRTLVQLGGVFAHPDDQDRLLDALVAMAEEDRCRLVAVQLLRPDAERYAAKGFTVNQFGASYGRSLPDFNLKGRTHMYLRNRISRGRRAGLIVSEAGFDSPVIADLDAIDRDWLTAKGRHVKELTFMVGERTGPLASMRRLFVATDGDGVVQGYITFSPVHGARPGWLYDLSRRRPDGCPGTMELLTFTAIERFRSEGAGYIHFGLTPFTGLDTAHELPGHSRVAARLVHLLAERGHHVYPAAQQVAFKHKWGPDLVEPEYVAFKGRVSLRSVWRLLRLTNAL
ncbi:MAG: hypothetical protein QOE93_265 [Actinomycetota bacterium]|nr:hypothetical protein [Actinomycetota bacterium]